MQEEHRQTNDCLQVLFLHVMGCFWNIVMYTRSYYK